jgi:hypothetical protein
MMGTRKTYMFMEEIEQSSTFPHHSMDWGLNAPHAERLSTSGRKL